MLNKFSQIGFNSYFTNCILIVSLLIIFFVKPVFAQQGGVVSTNGQINFPDGAMGVGNGNGASAEVNLKFNVSRIVSLGVFDETGDNSSLYFSNPSNIFSENAYFSPDGNVLIQGETNMNSKFDIDGYSSVLDVQRILDAMNSLIDYPSQDYIVKGVIFSSSKKNTNLDISLDKNLIVFTGGTGLAPIVRLKMVMGLPGNSDVRLSLPQAGASLDNNLINNKGYSRFVVVGDLNESSVSVSTDGDWFGEFTIQVVIP